MPTQLRIGLIGAGRIGRVHASNIMTRLPNARVTIVADSAEQAAQRCAADFGIARAAGDYRAVLEAADVDAVAICTATDTHAQIIEEAAQAGKQIFCEKPIALDLATIDRALAAVERAGVTLQIGFNRRFDANFRRVRQAVEQGEVGRVELLHIISRDPAPPPIAYVRVSGGMFIDMSIHDFDMARYLTGDEVTEVYASGGALVDPAIGAAGDIDTALTVLKFAGGAIGTIDNSRRAVYGYDQRVEVFGSAGAIASSNNYPNNTTISDARSVRRDLPLNFFMDRYTESFVSELDAFVAAVTSGAPVPVSGRDGRAPVVIALAARKSLELNRPVRLAEVEPAG